MKYWAFISYSHKDSGIADWLHPKLEKYRVPRNLVGTPSRDGTVPARLLPIFRDRVELPTSAELGDNLQRSLEQSRYLIVICSPDSAQSRWVEEEIRAFRNLNGRDRTIALIARGVPNASDTVDAVNECFPNALRYETKGSAPPERVEPIASDMRPEADGRERAFLKVVAGLLGVGFDDLYQREKRRRSRRRMIGVAAVAALVLIMVSTWWSIVRLGHSQKQIQNDVVQVKQDAAAATTDFKDVRPKNKEAEDRIDAVA